MAPERAELSACGPQDAHSRPLTRPQPFKLRTNNWAGEDGGEGEPAADGTQSQRVAVPPAGVNPQPPPARATTARAELAASAAPPAAAQAERTAL